MHSDNSKTTELHAA
jgi:hypothetical protein